MTTETTAPACPDCRAPMRPWGRGATLAKRGVRWACDACRRVWTDDALTSLAVSTVEPLTAAAPVPDDECPF